MASEPQRVVVDVCLRLRIPFCWRGPGTLLISGIGVVAVIEELEKARHRVIGLEGFDLDGASVHPRLDLIYDADTAWRDGPASVASGWDRDVWVDITLA